MAESKSIGVGVIGTAFMGKAHSIAYAAVAGLLLSLNLATRYAWWVKGVGVVLVTGLYVGSWNGLTGLLGWATPEPSAASTIVSS